MLVTPEVKFMIDHFMEYHNEGKTIKEIAELCGITPRTIYSYLGGIAKQNHVSRESLLQIPHKQHRKPQVQNRQQTKRKGEYRQRVDEVHFDQEESPVIQQEENKPVNVNTASLMNEYEVVLSRVNDLLKVAEESTQKYRRN